MQKQLETTPLIMLVKDPDVMKACSPKCLLHIIKAYGINCVRLTTRRLEPPFGRIASSEAATQALDLLRLSSLSLSEPGWGRSVLETARVLKWSNYVHLFATCHSQGDSLWAFSDSDSVAKEGWEWKIHSVNPCKGRCSPAAERQAEMLEVDKDVDFTSSGESVRSVIDDLGAKMVFRINRGVMMMHNSAEYGDVIAEKLGELERESEKRGMGTFIENWLKNWLKNWSRISLGSNCYKHLEVESMHMVFARGYQSFSSL
ncbi:hypothetical protein EV424DRAFT_1341436 [Suillus variegatus]|nr:hypothetical protein EV424DRAFT_1341436 [Suillus variegatus]